MSTKEAFTDTGKALAYEWFDRQVDATKMKPEYKEAIKDLARLAEAWIVYCASAKKDPTDKKAMIAFLLNHSNAMMKLAGDGSRAENMVCASAVATVVINAPQKIRYLRGGPVGITAAFGLLILEMLDVGNSCEGVQRWTYETFLRDSKPIIQHGLRTNVAG